MGLWLDVAGWTGAVLMLASYLSVSMGWLRAGRRFQIANLIGSTAFILNGAYYGAWPSVVTNVAWFLISAVALVRMRQGSAADESVPAGPEAGVPDAEAASAAVSAVVTAAVPVVTAAVPIVTGAVPVVPRAAAYGSPVPAEG
ncbi:hypothetical protein BIU82_11630 [Arthrobacter sp. SW1]|uniref:CBU_0592 family membrane protein n=1 Tax=Arthrobacter sp. SW1 TaxID=1920889 RepID=UPI000877E139|nr:YgjV family protein [Arthrobacter sp. SW1]OFI36728.1 hypothetical protein BIU82_11630 [Arthrobacter sp. SW1]